MAIHQIELKKKIALTHDVFELVYSFPEDTRFQAGQFITFLLPVIWGRAYSILEKRKDEIVLIIKRRSLENGGRGGSIALCDGSVWNIFKAVGPVGHFVLQNTKTPKCFIGTGTGFVPLYSHFTTALENGFTEKLLFIFGVRKGIDLFYLEELKNLSLKYKNFSFILSTSQEEMDWCHKGYVTDLISEEVTEEYWEYYICWAPAMIDASIEKLKGLWINEANIYFEKYA